jgi:hypothetical protein
VRSAPPTRPVICASVAPWFPPYEGGFRGRLVRLDLTLLVRPLISEALSNDAIAFAVLEPQQLQGGHGPGPDTRRAPPRLRLRGCGRALLFWMIRHGRAYSGAAKIVTQATIDLWPPRPLSRLQRQNVLKSAWCHRRMVSD